MAKRCSHKKSGPVSILKLEDHLLKIDADCVYGDWIKAMLVVFNETEGSEEGFKLVDAWSSQGVKYKGYDEVRSKWDSFDLDHPSPVTLGTLIWMAKSQTKN